MPIYYPAGNNQIHHDAKQQWIFNNYFQRATQVNTKILKTYRQQ
jgi:hypothetical protein